MIELNDEESSCFDELDLVCYWLDKGIINCSDIINAYTSILNAEKLKLADMLSESDTYVSTLIDNNKKMMNYQRPYAIKYMLDNGRLKGSQWYNELKEKYKKEQ